MKITKLLVLPVIIAFLSACSDNGDSPVQSRPALPLTFTESPLELPGLTYLYAEDVRYGPAERNVFDIYLPDCNGPTPLVIYIHGGGFTGGDKQPQMRDAVPEFLSACVAHAAINYTLLDIPSAEEGTESSVAQGGVLTSLNDAARALQFMRYHFESLNIDAENVALYGGSAGAGASLWLGTHDDMADLANPDPVLRESTRVKAVAALATQATYDLLVWGDILLPITEPLESILGGTDVVSIASRLGQTNYLLTFLGVATTEEIFEPANVAYRANVDMLALMDAGDAPIFVRNFDTGFDDPLNLLLHHGLHALAVKDRADEVGLHSVAYSEDEDPRFRLEDPSGEDFPSFLIRHIQ